MAEFSGRGKRLFGDLGAADDTGDLDDPFFFGKGLDGRFCSAVGLRFGNEKMRVGNRRDLRRVRHTDDLRTLLRDLV